MLMSVEAPGLTGPRSQKYQHLYESFAHHVETLGTFVGYPMVWGAFSPLDSRFFYEGGARA
jgi:hypothetical protein